MIIPVFCYHSNVNGNYYEVLKRYASGLSTYSLNNGPDEESGYDMRVVTFRFTSWDWDNTLQKLLAKHNIPVISESTSIKEVV